MAAAPGAWRQGTEADMALGLEREQRVQKQGQTTGRKDLRWCGREVGEGGLRLWKGEAVGRWNAALNEQSLTGLAAGWFAGGREWQLPERVGAREKLIHCDDGTAQAATVGYTCGGHRQADLLLLHHACPHALAECSSTSLTSPLLCVLSFCRTRRYCLCKMPSASMRGECSFPTARVRVRC